MKQEIAVLTCCVSKAAAEKKRLTGQELVHLVLGGYFLLIAVGGGPPQVIGFAATAAILYVQLMIGDVVFLPEGEFRVLLIVLGMLPLVTGIVFWIWLFFSGNGRAAVEAACVFSAGQICKPRWSQGHAVFLGLLLWALSAIGQVLLYSYFMHNRMPRRKFANLQKSQDVLDFSSMSYASHGTPSLTCTSTLSAENDKVICPAVTAISPVYPKPFYDKTWVSASCEKSLKHSLDTKSAAQFSRRVPSQTSSGPRKLRSMRTWKQLGLRPSLYTTWYAPFYSSGYPRFPKKPRSFLNLKTPLINLHFPKSKETDVEGPDWNTWDFSNFSLPVCPNVFSQDGLNLDDSICNNRGETRSISDTPDASFDSKMSQCSCYRKFFEQDLNKAELKNDCTEYSCMGDLVMSYKLFLRFEYFPEFNSLCFTFFLRTLDLRFMGKKRKLKQNNVDIQTDSDKKNSNEIIVRKFKCFTESLKDLIEYVSFLEMKDCMDEEKKIHKVVLKFSDIIRNDPFLAEVLPVFQFPLEIEHAKESEIPFLPEIKDPVLLKQVFTHRSYAYATQSYNVSEREVLKLHNERLEFLGDSYLNHAVTKLLFKAFPDAREGELSVMRSQLVGNTKAEKISRLYGFDKRLLLSESAESDNVRSLKKIVADIFESYIGGLVLDSSNGEEIAFRWISQLMAPDICLFQKKQKGSIELDKMAKQTLYNRIGREFNTDGQTRKKIEYIWIGGEGGNKDGYEYSCRIDGEEVGRGWGPNQKIAGIRSAMDALSKLSSSD
ncbi:hypothetical protein PORY_000851 [Pneumocystis oryctolagi]|uniref:Uncharacterized protein n=1 Tax=Pneumocystis oryctolagi TaxID=42067 RepID=A0ACB7CDT3_9ASCO|nr:hypothetical protein PORY_000851 [Pneumocystis oryctolagi]